MAKFDPRFQLKQPNCKGKTEIRLRVSFDYTDFVWNIKDSMGCVLKIYPQLWDKNKQYPIPKSKITKTFQNETYNLQVIGITIDKIKVIISEIKNDYALAGKKITKDLLRNELLIKLGLEKKKKEITLMDFCEETIKEMESGVLLIDNTKQYTKSTIDKYKYTATIFKVFKSHTTFSEIDKNWYNEFIQFLTRKQSIVYKDSNGEEKLFEKKDLQPGSISNYIKNLKFLMGHAVEKEISKNKNHTEKWFVRPKEKKGYGNIHIALNEYELKEIYNFNTSKVGLNPTYEKAKDLFLVGCYTGLRVSDFNSGLSAKDFKTIKHKGKKEEVLIITTKKTGSLSYTPAIWSELKQIFKKYDYQLPTLSDNTIREYTQKICEYIKGFDETTSCSITLGGKIEKIKKAKWKMVGNHTGRRSFITNLKNRGYSFEEIGEFTGQSTPAIIKEYDKTPRTDSVIRIKQKYENKSKTK
jgi:hypothetical protein